MDRCIVTTPSRWSLIICIYSGYPNHFYYGTWSITYSGPPISMLASVLLTLLGSLNGPVELMSLTRSLDQFQGFTSWLPRVSTWKVAATSTRPSVHVTSLPGPVPGLHQLTTPSTYVEGLRPSRTVNNPRYSCQTKTHTLECVLVQLGFQV